MTKLQAKKDSKSPKKVPVEVIEKKGLKVVEKSEKKNSKSSKKVPVEVIEKKGPKVAEKSEKKVMKVADKSKPAMKAKEARPKKKSDQVADKNARVAIGSGDIAKDEAFRKKDQDLRTLYVRFGNKINLPSSSEEIKELHPDIKFVRTPRTAVKGQKAGTSIGYAFVEFGTEDECMDAHKKLSMTQFKGKEMVVDFVGAKSKNKKQKAQASGSGSSRLNPTRLFICGLAPGVSKTNLKEMFPKAAHADIPQRSKSKGTSFGFVQFSTPGDAKAAFDAAKDLSIADHKITVLFAKLSEAKPEVLQQKAEKRKKRLEDKKEKRAKGENGERVAKAENDEDEESDEDEEETKVNKKTKKEEIKDESNDDEEDDNDEEEDDDEEEDSKDEVEAADDGSDDEDDDDDDE